MPATKKEWRKYISRCCTGCGIRFDARVDNGKPALFCSRQCFLNHQKKKNWEEKICEVCGDKFLYRTTRGTKGRCCSKKCAGILTGTRLRRGTDLENGKKKCATCLQIKVAKDFYSSVSDKDGLQCECKKCNRERGIKYRAQLHVKARNKKRYEESKVGGKRQLKDALYRLKKIYGFSQYESILIYNLARNHFCFICKKPAKHSAGGNNQGVLHCDHKHLNKDESGPFRGLLCDQCNWKVGSTIEKEILLGRITAGTWFDYFTNPPGIEYYRKLDKQLTKES
jgi:hypothetical protein